MTIEMPFPNIPVRGSMHGVHSERTFEHFAVGFTRDSCDRVGYVGGSDEMPSGLTGIDQELARELENWIVHLRLLIPSPVFSLTFTNALDPPATETYRSGLSDTQ